MNVMIAKSIEIDFVITKVVIPKGTVAFLDVATGIAHGNGVSFDLTQSDYVLLN